MKAIIIGAFALSISSASLAAIETLTFDDLTTFTVDPVGGTSQPIYTLLEATGYGGFEWQNIFLMWFKGQESEQPVSGYENGVVSGEYIAWNNDNSDGVITRSNPFNFHSVYMTAAWEDGLGVTVEGYTGGLLGAKTYSTDVAVDTSGPTFFQFDYLNIDTLRFVTTAGTNAGLGGGGQQIVFDDLTYQPIPIPTAAWLFASSLLGLIGIRKFRRGV